MRVAILTLFLTALSGFLETAQAQRFVIVPATGISDGVIIVAELPAESRALLRQELGCEPKIAWLYETFCIGSDRFDFWRYNGRFVLMHENKYWNVPRDVLVSMLGPQGESILSIPWSYWFPTGIVTVVVIIAVVILVAVRLSRIDKRLHILQQDERYVAAMQAYLQRLPESGVPSYEQHQEYIAAGVAHLVDQGEKARTAKSQLKSLLRAASNEHANDLRVQAFELAEAGQWVKAMHHFQEAADVAHYWNADSAKFLRGRVKWCRQQAERAGQDSTTV